MLKGLKSDCHGNANHNALEQEHHTEQRRDKFVPLV